MKTMIFARHCGLGVATRHRPRFSRSGPVYPADKLRKPPQKKRSAKKKHPGLARVLLSGNGFGLTIS
jgi:hypothetical protein